MGRPLFLVLDGVDGVGKSTQARRLVERMRVQEGRSVLHLREPGSTRLGEGLRALLLDRGQTIDVGSEALLFAAARRQMLIEQVRPALAKGETIVCERFHASTLAYQGVAGGLGYERVERLLDDWASDPAPDLVLLLGLAPAEAARRSRAVADRIEARGLAFQEAVARGFALYAERAPAARPIDAAGSADEVAARIWEEVRGALR